MGTIKKSNGRKLLVASIGVATVSLTASCFGSVGNLMVTPRRDAGFVFFDDDAGPADAGTLDAGPLDAGEEDAGEADAGEDAGS